MSASKHTPGPWTYDADSGFVRDSVGGPVAQTWDNCEQDFENAAANGPLLAAAPTNAELTRIELELTEAVLALDVDTCCRPNEHKWKEITPIARRFMEAAKPKGNQ